MDFFFEEFHEDTIVSQLSSSEGNDVFPNHET